MRTSVRWIIRGVTGVACFTGTTGVALAADGYGGAAGQQTGGGSAGNLPFTGTDLLTYVLVAIAIMAAGLALRATSDRRSGVNARVQEPREHQHDAN